MEVVQEEGAAPDSCTSSGVAVCTYARADLTTYAVRPQEIAATFKTLKLRPGDFPRLLTEVRRVCWLAATVTAVPGRHVLTDCRHVEQDVGFASVRQLPAPSNATQGFDRPLYLCTK